MTQIMIKPTLLLAAVLTSAMVVPASATDITIQDFVGKITIVDGNDGLDVVRVGKYPIDFRNGGDDFFIDGGLSQKQRNKACDYSPRFSLSINGHEWNDKALDDYPELVISVAEGSNLTIRDSALRLNSEVKLGTADLDVGGCFDLKIDAADTLTLEKSGSGEIDIGSAGTLDLSKSGSGEVKVGQTGRFDLKQSGSGEVEVDRVDGAMTINKSGSGDIEIDMIDGDLSIEKSGSGDVTVEGGAISDLSVRNSGSGDVDIYAAVGDAYVRASGAGDVYVKSISGALDESTSGASDFSRGDD